jgi:hypothetical protein
VFQRFFAPALDAYGSSDLQYNCSTFSDLDFLEMGVLRCLSESQTGRDFVQRHGDQGRLQVDLGLFFKSIKSDRRIANLRSVNDLTKNPLAKVATDPFAAIPELNGFEIYVGDGHFHAAAVHDAKDTDNNGNERKLPTGHFFMLNLRTHHLSHLGTADVHEERKSEHDIHLIKRTAINLLRGGAPKGTRVLLGWDRAAIDFAFWQRAKATSGLYFVSREKSNMKLTVSAEKQFDPTDERNRGVISDELVIPASGGPALRRIVYTDPETRKEFRFLTTEMTLPPGIICLIYKQRWDIEKVFDEVKNKLNEKKSWGSGKESKTSNALFICLTHNLLVLMEATIGINDNIFNETESERREERKVQSISNGANFVATFVQRCTVRSVKFIRWLRNFVYREAPWSQAAARLREVYAFF